MNEEQRNQDSDQNQNQDQDTSQKIELEADVYQALLDRLDELEDKSGKTGDVIKDLASEGRGKSGEGEGRQEDVDLDKLSQTELAQYIVGQMEQQVINPMALELQNIRLEREIDKLTSDEEYKAIFESNQELVFKIASENPRLSLKRACDLAFKETGKKDKGSDKSGSETRDAKLRHLPKVAAHSEKPRGTGSQLEKEEPENRRSAAAQAIDKLGIKFDH